MKETTREGYRERIERVLRFIRAHLDESLSLDDLARVALFSPFHFHRIFRALVGEGVKEHLRRLRLERAAGDLAGTRREIIQIAFDAGYESHEAFSRAFRSQFGLSPSGFRQKGGPLAPPPTRLRYRPDGSVEWITFYSNGGKIMDVTIKTLPPRLVVSLRHLGPYFEVGPTWEKLCAWAGSKGLISPNTMFFGISYDDPDSTPPAEIRYDACIVVDKPVPVEGDFQLQEVAGGEYAVGLHIGPYDGLKDAYAYLYGQWIPAQKREIRDAPPYEVCLNDPGVTPPEELKTEICIPLA